MERLPTLGELAEKTNPDGGSGPAEYRSVFVRTLVAQLKRSAQKFEHETYDIVTIQNMRKVLQDICSSCFHSGKLEQWEVLCNRKNNTDEDMQKGIIHADVRFTQRSATHTVLITVSRKKELLRGWFNNRRA